MYIFLILFLDNDYSQIFQQWKKQFEINNKEKYVRDNLTEHYGEYYFKNRKCQFLDENSNCKIEKCLPRTCKEYPYTNKEERLFSLASIVANASVCPVVYEILEELKKEYHFK